MKMGSVELMPPTVNKRSTREYNMGWSQPAAVIISLALASAHPLETRFVNIPIISWRPGLDVSSTRLMLPPPPPLPVAGAEE